jgi:hypothetical protein
MKFKPWLILGLLANTYVYADIPKTGGDHPTVKFQAECEGYSLIEAKQQCFNLAIEQVVGQVVVSDLESSGDRITRDTIGQYSAGYIDNYVVQEQRQDEHGWYHLKMTISVASSKIAQRKMSRGEHTEITNGDRAMASLESEIEQRNRGDTLIGQVLSSYPENAYVVNSGQTEFKISNLRQAYVDIPYSINMSRSWIEALDEALGLVAADSNKCNKLIIAIAQGINRSNTRLGKEICGNSPDIRVSSGFWSFKGYYFPDIETLHVINNELRTEGQQHIGLRVDLIDAGGNIIDSRCARINNERFIRYERPVGTYNLNDRYTDSRPNIFGQENVYGTLRVSIRNTQQMEDLAKIKLNVQRTCT